MSNYEGGKMSGCNVYNEEHQQLFVKFFNHVTAEDLEHQAASLAANVKISEAKRKYISFFAASEFDENITLEKMAEIAKVLKISLKSQEKFRTALVAPSVTSFGIARMIQECLKAEEGQGEVKLFTSKEEAFDWLGGSKKQWTLMREHVSQLCSL